VELAAHQKTKQEVRWINFLDIIYDIEEEKHGTY
jgi:hypothetical protein